MYSMVIGYVSKSTSGACVRSIVNVGYSTEYLRSILFWVIFFLGCFLCDGCVHVLFFGMGFFFFV